MKMTTARQRLQMKKTTQGQKLSRNTVNNKAEPTVPIVESDVRDQKVLKATSDEEDWSLTLSSQWLYFQPGV